MTSQNSTNNKISFFRLMQDDLRHKSWMIVLSVLGSFLAGPVVFLFSISNAVPINNRGIRILTEEEITFYKAQTALHTLEQDSLILMLVIAFLGAMIVGWFGFFYLYNKRMTDLYHSAPVTRRRLFLVSWLNGFLIWLVPSLFFQIFDYAAGAVYIKDGSYLGALTQLTVRNIFYLCLCFLIVYHTCLVAVMLSGNVINAILNTLIYGLFFFAAYFLYLAFMHIFMDHFYLPERMMVSNPTYLLSPLTTPVIMTAYLMSETALREWLWLPVFGALLMALNGILAFFLYKKRPSELAARGLDSKPARILFRTAATVLAGLAFSLFFYEIADRGRMYWMAFGAVFGTALAFGVLNICYHTTFKNIFSHKLQYTGILVFTGALILILTKDLFGYDRYVPSKEAITGLSIQCDSFYGSGDVRYKWADNGLTYRAYNAQPLDELRFTDRDAIYNLLTHAAQGEWSDRYCFHFMVKVFTRFGSYYRQYTIPYADLDYLRPFVESEDYLNEYYAGIQLQFGMPESIDLTSAQGILLELKDPSRIRTLTETLHRDFQEHSTMEDLARSNRMDTANLQYRCDDGRLVTLSYGVSPWYENTLALLKEWYPLQTWDYGDVEIDSIHFSLIGEADGRYTTPLEYLYDYFGYDRNGLSLEAQIHDSYPSGSELPQGSVQETLMHYGWNLDITSPEMIQRIRPYLLMNRYYNLLCEDYVALGNAQLPDETSYRCFIPYGKMPLELIQWLADNITEIRDENDEKIGDVPTEVREIYD